ncbi:hypothetical protein [Saccharibacillus kuerlensis]|uniref:Uncharacterized protein n=1 Tax=Saccharibacillus kuerlensis TaxID=459527 RepID=A0ABQ2L5H8_9BACL|nr:hypothetical protein [Saccharibacillus kuerlensis]GGO04339.1 hypothetical protein GCM10010969_29460 [Saccharibacillus kuerlensis]
MAEIKPKLQSLRIPAGWKVDVNTLYELEPSLQTIDWFSGSILFSAVQRKLGYEVYVRWEPQSDPAGVFFLQRYLLKYEEQGDSVLEGYFVDEQRIGDRQRLVERLEAYMLMSEWT